MLPVVLCIDDTCRPEVGAHVKEFCMGIFRITITRVNVTLEILYVLNRKLFVQYNEILCTLFESEQKVR